MVGHKIVIFNTFPPLSPLMTIAKIRDGNRITIPKDEMQKRNLHIGDEIHLEISGVIGRDMFIGRGGYTVANSNIAATHGSWYPTGTVSTLGSV